MNLNKMGSLQPENTVKQEFDDSGCVQDASDTENGYRGQVQLLDLSDDVLLYILRFCTPRDLKALGHTCPRLGLLVCDRTLWTRVDARSDPIGQDRLRWLLTHCLSTSTNELQIKGYASTESRCLGIQDLHFPGDSEAGRAGAAAGVDVEHFLLRMWYPHLPRFAVSPRWPDKKETENKAPKKVQEARQKMKAEGVTKTFTVKPSRCNKPEASEGFDGKVPTQLDEEIMANCKGPQFSFTFNLMKELKEKCPNLTSLTLEYCNIDYKSTSIRHFPARLKKLSLRGTRCYNLPTNTSFLCKIHDRLPELEVLDVSECDWFEPASLMPLSKVPNLVELYMRECRRLTECVAYASLATRYGFRKLKILDCRRSPLADSEVSAFGWLPCLEELYIAPPEDFRNSSEHTHSWSDTLFTFQELDPWEILEPDYYKIRDEDPDEDEEMRDGGEDAEETDPESPLWFNHERRVIVIQPEANRAEEPRRVQEAVARANGAPGPVRPGAGNIPGPGRIIRHGHVFQRIVRNERFNRFAAELENAIRRNPDAQPEDVLNEQAPRPDVVDPFAEGMGRRQQINVPGVGNVQGLVHVVRQGPEFDRLAVRLGIDDIIRPHQARVRGNDNPEQPAAGDDMEGEEGLQDLLIPGLGNVRQGAVRIIRQGPGLRRELAEALGMENEFPGPEVPEAAVPEAAVADVPPEPDHPPMDEPEPNVCPIHGPGHAAADCVDLLNGPEPVVRQNGQNQPEEPVAIPEPPAPEQNMELVRVNQDPGEVPAPVDPEPSMAVEAENQPDNTPQPKAGPSGQLAAASAEPGSSASPGPSSMKRSHEESVLNLVKRPRLSPNDDDPQNPQDDPQIPQNDPQNPQNNPQNPQNDPQNPQNDPQNPQNDPPAPEFRERPRLPRPQPGEDGPGPRRIVVNVCPRPGCQDAANFRYVGLINAGAGPSRNEARNDGGNEARAEARNEARNDPQIEQQDRQYELPRVGPRNVRFRRNENFMHIDVEQSFADGMRNAAGIIGYNLVSNSAIHRFGRADNDNINYVHIGRNGIQDASESDPGARPDRSALRVLSAVGYRNITNASLEHLASAAPHLRFLDFSYTGVTQAGVDVFKAIRPNCKVEWSEFGKMKEGEN